MNLVGHKNMRLVNDTICKADGAIDVGQFVRIIASISAVGERVCFVQAATAASPSTHPGALGVCLGTMTGAAAVAGDVVIIRWSGTYTYSGAAVAGALVYLNDTGYADDTPGTIRRVVGTARSLLLGVVSYELTGYQDLRYDDAITFDETSSLAGSKRNLRIFFGLRVSTLDVAIAGGGSTALPCDDHTYLVTCSGGAGAITVTLPALPVDGTEITVKDANGGAAVNNLVVDGNGKNIDAAGTLTMSTAWASATLRYVRSKWYVVARVG